ncbi:MAG: hypothetical protein H7Z38_14585 [Rubrivivax sp.]|nr:hypothetical protein [Pyrinomonadaceae bacterium]
MAKAGKRFVAKAEAGKGWRIWNNKQKRWWGEHYESFPEHLLAELNGEKKPEQLTELIKKTPRKRVK